MTLQEIYDKALEAYPYDIQGQYAYDANDGKRVGYIKGYQEAIEQMMAKAIRGRVRVNVESNYHSLIYGCWDMNDALKNCNDGSKVKVIVIKED